MVAQANTNIYLVLHIGANNPKHSFTLLNSTLKPVSDQLDLGLIIQSDLNGSNIIIAKSGKQRIPLTNITVQRHIDETSHDIESILFNYLQTTRFSIQLDKSTSLANEAPALPYVRFVMDQELLFARSLSTDTKGEPVLNLLGNYFAKIYTTFQSTTSPYMKIWPTNAGRNFITAYRETYRQ